MAIEPNTNIKVYHNVPLDLDQERSIAWANISEQNAYFHTVPSSILKYNFARTTYQRVREGVMRVEQTADNLYDCNYLAFQNTNYGNKWFYAFITSVEYINDITTEITFVLDDLQTWYFEMVLQPCIIERCHTTTDVIGDHIEPEPVTLGEYVMNYRKNGQGQVLESYAPLYGMSDLAVIIAIVDVSTSVSGKLYDNIYGSATLWAFEQTNVAGINQKIAEYLLKPESIISMYMCPHSFISSQLFPETGYEIPSRSMVNGIIASASTLTTSAKIDGYTPRNKKLYTYPYNYYHIDNSMGSSLALRYEFFEGLSPRFEINGTITQPVECTIRPYNYKNCTADARTGVFQATLNTEVLTITTFPMCSWNTDGFQAYMVQNGIPYGINAIGSGLDSFANAGLNVALAAASGGGGAEGVTNYLSDPKQGASRLKGLAGSINIGKKTAEFATMMYKASTASDISRGNFSNASVDCACGRHQFYGGRCSITAEYARIIDDFFDKYGYTSMRLATPNLRARPHWTYIKTRGCAMKGSLPATSKKNIQSYFDSGITFWKTASEVGDYTLDNTV